LFKSLHADARSGCVHARYYAVQITASQFLDRPSDASTSVTHSCNHEFAAISRYISETMQKLPSPTECQYEVLCDLLNGVISNDIE